jgi:hypothetical protein
MGEGRVLNAPCRKLLRRWVWHARALIEPVVMEMLGMCGSAKIEHGNKGKCSELVSVFTTVSSCLEMQDAVPVQASAETTIGRRL